MFNWIVDPQTLEKAGAFVGGLLVGAFGWHEAYLKRQTASIELQKAKTELEKARTELENTKDNQRTAVKAVENAFKADYEMDEFRAEFVMHDGGTITYKRHCERLTTRAGAVEVHVPYEMNAPDGSVGPVKLTPNTYTMRPYPGNTAQRYRGRVIIPSYAFDGKHEVSFSIEQDVTKAFFLSKEDSQKTQQSDEDYFGTLLTVTVKRLVMDVEFPTMFVKAGINARGNVYYGESSIPNSEEIQRFAESGRVEPLGSNRFRLTMDNPAKGQMYALVWDPPPLAALAAS
jgi:hypothetical protein